MVTRDLARPDGFHNLFTTLTLPAHYVAHCTMENQTNSQAPIFELEGVSVRYGGKLAVKEVTAPIPTNRITALIGASGCGKSTLLRCLNRMNDLIPGATVEGKVSYQGLDLYAPSVDPVQVRRHVGMVFQKPNPFPKSIYDNVAFGPRVLGMDKDPMRTLDEIVESALTRASLWDEVKDRLSESAIGMSGGQQQRLCIARTIAAEPNVILMDEPCSALDPISTSRVEDLMVELKEHYTIVVVTHNMQQAARVSDMTAYFSVEVGEDDKRFGRLIEYDETETIFTNPNDQRTEDYVTGKVG
jgi:phosphate transport system ATP-binding protein